MKFLRIFSVVLFFVSLVLLFVPVLLSVIGYDNEIFWQTGWVLWMFVPLMMLVSILLLASANSSIRLKEIRDRKKAEGNSTDLQ